MLSKRLQSVETQEEAWSDDDEPTSQKGNKSVTEIVYSRLYVTRFLLSVIRIKMMVMIEVYFLIYSSVKIDDIF